MRLPFGGAIHRGACNGFVKIHEVTVKFGTVHAGKFDLSAHSQAAAAAHTRAVDHDGVHRNNGGDVVFFCQQADEFHHRQGAYGNDLVVLLAALNQRAQSIGHKTSLAPRAVIRDGNEFGGVRLEFFFKDDQFAVAEAHNGVHLGAALKQCFGNGVGNGTSNAAANNGDLFQPVKMRCVAKRADKIRKGIAHIQVVESLGACANDLKDHRYTPFGAVVIGNCQG